VPDRFVGGPGAPPVEYSYSKVGVGQDFRSVPFGAGRRGCPGAGFAAPTVELALANLVYHFDWAAPTAHGGGVDVSEVYGLSVRLKTPLTKWTGLGALDKCIHAYQYCASRARCVFCVTVW
jgi:cytochrome P450